MAEIWTRATRQRQPQGAVALSAKYADAVAIAAPWLWTENQAGPGSKWTSWGTAPVRGSGSAGVSVDTNFSGWQITPKKNPGEVNQTHVIVAEVSATSNPYAGLFCVQQSGAQTVLSMQLNASSTKWSAWTGNVTPVGEIETTILPVFFSKKTIAISRTQGRVKVFVDGTNALDAASSAGGYSGSSVVLAGERGASNAYALKSKIYLYAGFVRAFPDDELRDLSLSPWQLFAPERRATYFFPASGIPTLSAATAVSIGSTTATPRVTVTF